MKRFVSKILLFFILTAIIDFISGGVFSFLRANAKGGIEKEFSNLFEKDNHEVLILGSSRANHHYVPEVIEKKWNVECYNGGFDGNGVILAYPIIRNVIERNKPKLLIYEVSAGFDIVENIEDANDTRYIANLKPYYRNDIAKEVIASVSESEIIKLHSALYRHNSSLTPLVIDNITIRSGRKDGYTPLYRNYKPERDATSKKVNYTLDSLKLNYLHKLASLHMEKNLDIIWVVSPQYYSDYDNSIYNMAKNIALIYDVPFMDYTKDKRFIGHGELFSDPTHLNDTGAHLFTNILVNDISDAIALNE